MAVVYRSLFVIGGEFRVLDRRGQRSGPADDGIGATFRSKAYFAANSHMTVTGRFADETEHANRSIRLVAALDGPVRFRANDGRVFSSERLLIPPLRRHALLGYEGRLVSISFDHSFLSVSAWAGKPITAEVARDATLEDDFRKLFEEEDHHLDACLLMDRWIDAWANGASLPIRIDARVAVAKSFIDAAGGVPVGRRHLARMVGLSPSRFAAIFASQTGTSLSRYLVWYRCLKALRLVAFGESVTGAAVLAGFSDGAHLTRSSRSMFGVPPSRFAGIGIRQVATSVIA